MIEKMRATIFEMLREMNYDVAEESGALVLGPEGLDLESLAVAELAVRIEDEYGVRFGDEEAAGVAKMTVDEFVAAVAERAGLQPEPAGDAA
jgi:acyl carrier protein